MAPKTEPYCNPEKLESLLKNLHRLVGVRPKALKGIGQNRKAQQYNRDQKSVTTEEPQWATEAEQKQPVKKA